MADQAIEIPINRIAPFITHWVIKAKILNKSEFRYTSKKTPFFETVLIDNAGDVILAQYWGKSAEKWFPALTQNKSYAFSNGMVEVANKHFNSLPHPYNLKFNEYSKIDQLDEDTKIEGKRNLTYTNLRCVFTSKKPPPFNVNLMVVVSHVEPPRKLTKKDGSEILLRKITVVDDTDYEFTLAIWSEEAKNPIYDEIEGKVTSFSEITVTERNEEGKSGKIGFFSDIVISPEGHQRAKELKQWLEMRDPNKNYTKMRTNQLYESSYQNPLHVNISKMKKDSEINMGRYITVARLVKIYWKKKTGEESLVYPSCSRCKRKMIFDSYGEKYECEPCGESSHTPIWRYMFSIFIMDHTGASTAKVFDDTGSSLLDVSAEEINSWDPSRKQSYLENEMISKLFEFSIKARLDTYNAEKKVMYTLQSVSPIDFTRHSDEMISAINNWLPQKEEQNVKRLKETKSENDRENSIFEINS